MGATGVDDDQGSGSNELNPLHQQTELTGLDDAAWTYLMAQVIPLFEKKHPLRGWQAAFDKLNEAKAYNYLTRLGCTGVNFVPVSSEAWKKTPDLKAKLESQTVLCEVKSAQARGAVA